MRVVTLLPGATEIVAALGGAGSLVGISHECDYPASITHLPRVTSTPIDADAPGAVIDAEVRRLHEAGCPVIAVEAEMLARLRPELIVTQSLCEVCAVADGEVHRLAAVLQPAPRVLALSGRTLAGIMDDIRAVAAALDLPGEDDELIAGLESRLRRLKPVGDRRPRVVCVEWLSPLYLAGHWVPELVAAAGGEDVGARPGSHSARREWTELPALDPDLVVVMLCGFDVGRAGRELLELAPDASAILRSVPVWILDGNAYTSRPGPRVVDGAERLHAAMLGRELPGLTRWHSAGR
jgi:iron complex transport system substrate-binding protein